MISNHSAAPYGAVAAAYVPILYLCSAENDDATTAYLAASSTTLDPYVKSQLCQKRQLSRTAVTRMLVMYTRAAL